MLLKYKNHVQKIKNKHPFGSVWNRTGQNNAILCVLLLYVFIQNDQLQ